jgi:two-component sensor histidine kinase
MFSVRILIPSGPARLLAALLLLVLAAAPARAQHTPPLRARFFRLLHTGDSVYAEKKGYRSFARAQQYYDSAQVLAERSQDTLLLAEAVFARGRVYDAWNKEPLKTIDYFQRAAGLFRRLPAQRRRYFYARYLVAHAYDKVPDSLRTVQVLRQLRRELLAQPDTLRRQVPSTVEMALTATQVRNYPLADSLLRQLVRRAWVRNDPDTYDYLTHYYLAQARLDVYRRRRRPSPYLDSLAGIRVANAFDRVYYAHNLADLYAAAGQYPAAYAALRRATRLADSLNDGGGVDQVRQSLLLSEERAERRQRQYEAIRERARTWGLWGLGTGLAIISLLSFYLYRQGRRARRQSGQLAGANAALDAQVAQVELLNKEIQHRVKNNLHMIFSLLHMQERQTDNEEVIENLQAARLRVESIAALQNQLLRNPDVPDLTAFLKHLISAVVSCLANDRQVVTHLVTDDLHLSVNSYFALSLILNEWVTNSIKYAHPPDHVIEVNVTVKQRPHDVLIEYFDNGRPPAAAPAPGPDASGLGTQIITLLSQQLGATLTTRPGTRYHYQLCIPNGA